MNRSEVLEILSRSKPVLVARYGVARIALFESTARGTARPDIDILIAFDGPATSERYFGVQFLLEDLLGRPVDLVTDKACGRSCGRSSRRRRYMSDATRSTTVRPTTCASAASISAAGRLPPTPPRSLPR